MDLSKFQDYRTSEHEWGYEITLVNEVWYCGKLLVLEGGGRSSLHYHPIKRETFIILEGEVELELPGRDAPLELVMVLGAGDIEDIMPGELHRFRSVTLQSIILEVSTYHDDADVVRIESARSALDMRGVE